MKKGVDVGIIGGTGLYEIDGLKNLKEIAINTPFGRPSDKLVTGELNGVRIAFLSRHGKGHRIMPSEINYRANVYALKKLGVSSIISVSAVGSLKEELKPGTIVIVSQFFDRTYKRENTFFNKGIVAHVSMAEPVCKELSEILYKNGKALGYDVKNSGTYICIEGPQFSTKAESMTYRTLGFDVIGMTNLPEAKLAREAEVCYATLALVTDYDCWHQSESPVTVDIIIDTLNKNIHRAKEIIKSSINEIAGRKECVCRQSLKDAIVTSHKIIPAETKRVLLPVIGKYIKKERG